MNKFLCLGSLLLLSLAARAAFAQDDVVEKLTHDNVTDFIMQTTKMTAGAVDGMNIEQVKAYMSLHIMDGAQFSSKMIYDMPGQQEQDNEMKLSKEDFITGLSAGTKSLKGYDTDITIKKIKFSDHNHTATAVTETHDVVTMPVTQDDVMQDIPLEGTSTCEQKIVLSELGVIQMAGATCETKIEMQQP